MKSLNKCIVVACLLAGSIAAYGQSSLSGKWHGTENNLPTSISPSNRTPARPPEAPSSTSSNATLTVAMPYVDGQAGGPMENLNYEPEKLTFDMHRTDGSLVSFRVELVDADHAKLFRTSDNAPEGSGFPLVRVNP